MSESCVFGDPTWQSEQPKAAADTGGEKKEKKALQKARETQIWLGLLLPAMETDGEKEGRKWEWCEKE